MADHICPPEILSLWIADRVKAARSLGEWLSSLTIEDGDRVWIPDVGFLEAARLRTLPLYRREAGSE